MGRLSFHFNGGAISRISDAPPVTVFLETHQGAYTTSRTHNNASCLLFWERHLKRLSQSMTILLNSSPQLFFKPYKPAISLASSPLWESALEKLVNDSLSKALPIALEEREDREEFAITTLVSGNMDELNENEIIMDEEKFAKFLNVNVHIGGYLPPVFGIVGKGARLALVGCGRHLAAAKYSDWVRIRKPLEKLRPPPVTELLLSNDGDRILEGCVTNFFVVCCKDINEVEEKDTKTLFSLEVQTAPIKDGVLPGIIRQLVIEVCLREGISCREVAPSWSESACWEEAFITNSLRLLQHVETIQVPREWNSIVFGNWSEIPWTTKQFQEGPGVITKMIQEGIMKRVQHEGCPISNLCE